jgi:uncharacterized integral membrane protein
MLLLIILLLFGLLTAFFAGQNTSPVTVFFADYQLAEIPLYVVIIGAMVIGFFVSWLVSLRDTLFTTFALRGKESVIRNARKRIMQLNEKVRTLELENAKLAAQKPRENRFITPEEKQPYRPAFFNPLAPNA